MSVVVKVDKSLGKTAIETLRNIPRKTSSIVREPFSPNNKKIVISCFIFGLLICIFLLIYLSITVVAPGVKILSFEEAICTTNSIDIKELSICSDGSKRVNNGICVSLFADVICEKINLNAKNILIFSDEDELLNVYRRGNGCSLSICADSQQDLEDVTVRANDFASDFSINTTFVCWVDPDATDSDANVLAYRNYSILQVVLACALPIFGVLFFISISIVGWKAKHESHMPHISIIRRKSTLVKRKSDINLSEQKANNNKKKKIHRLRTILSAPSPRSRNDSGDEKKTLDREAVHHMLVDDIHIPPRHNSDSGGDTNDLKFGLSFIDETDISKPPLNEEKKVETKKDIEDTTKNLLLIDDIDDNAVMCICEGRQKGTKGRKCKCKRSRQKKHI